MRMIVAGLGRTGTQSIMAALEQLGLKTCSQKDIISNNALAFELVKAARGEVAFRPELLEGYDASVGWPLCFLFEEQLRCFPDAVCLLNVRDANKWFDSVDRAFKILKHARRIPLLTKAKVLDQMLGLLEERMGGPIDRARWTEGYHRHNETVRARVPKDRLIEYPLGSGWEPICHALGEPIPDTAFPTGNSSANGSFRSNVVRVFLGRPPR